MMPASREPVVAAESWGVTMKGHARAENQDAFLSWPEHLLWSVADGVGGGSQGREASRLLVKNLMQTPEPSSLDAHIRNVRHLLERSNRELRQSAHGDAASTIVTLLMHGDRAACLWSGDSRCYLRRGDILYQCTRDHTLRQRAIDRKELTDHEARRMVRGNVVTDAVGAGDVLRLDTACFPLRRGDRFLLCSDGLSNCVSPAALSAYLGRPGARDAALGMAEALQGCGHPDDATLVTVFLSGG
ncbi:serine/threonine-protein phosphatase [Desulfomicrobium salsuginis]